MRPSLRRTIRIHTMLALALFASVALLSAMTARAANASVPSAPFVLGASGGPQLNQPSAVAVDPSSGEAYVADTGNSIIESYGADGSFLGGFGDTLAASVGLNSPRGVAVDSQGDLFVSDSGNNRIAEITPAGFVSNSWGWGVSDGASRLETCHTVYNIVKGAPNPECHAGIAGGGAGQLHNPTGIAIDPANGNIYVSDTGNGRIEEFDSSGSYLGQLSYGNAFFPVGLSFDPTGNDVYVADANADRVDEFTAGGAFVREFGGGGTGFKNDPLGVAVDPSTSNVYLSDASGRVQEYDASGHYLGQLGSSGTSLGQLQAPMQLAFNPVTGDVLVADQGNNRVEALGATPPSCLPAGSATSFNGGTTLQVQCTDPGQQDQHLQIVSLPAHGSVTLQDGQFTYQPDPGFAGTDSFSFEAVGVNTSAPAIASILVHDPPVPTCQSQSDNVTENAPATLTLSCTASGAPVAYELVSDPAHGTLGAIDPATGSVTYTPATGYTGSDQIVFDAADATGVSSPATLTLTVAAPQPQLPSGPQPPTGQQTPAGAQAPTGPAPVTGAQGSVAAASLVATAGASPGPALHTVTCRSGARIKLPCSVNFAAGSWISRGSARVSYSVSRQGHALISGTATVRSGSFTLHASKGLRAGHYTLTVTLSHNHRRVRLTRTITIR